MANTTTAVQDRELLSMRNDARRRTRVLQRSYVSTATRCDRTTCPRPSHCVAMKPRASMKHSHDGGGAVMEHSSPVVEEL